MVEYRGMTIEDYAAVYALWQRTPGMGLNDRDDSEEGIGRYLACNPGLSHVALEDGAVIGVILCGHDGRRGIIHHMAVDTRKQGRGIGSRLLDCSLEALKAQEISKVLLVVFADNAAGNAFWEKRGFTAREDLVYRNRALL